jgi:hypothetical protein
LRVRIRAKCGRGRGMRRRLQICRAPRGNVRGPGAERQGIGVLYNTTAGNPGVMRSAGQTCDRMDRRRVHRRLRSGENAHGQEQEGDRSRHVERLSAVVFVSCRDVMANLMLSPEG